MTSLRFFLLVMTVVQLLVPAMVRAEPFEKPPQEDNSSPILYRQHLMSEELIGEQGKGYLPMTREKFEAAVRQRSRNTAHVTAARIRRADYFAKLVAEELLAGEVQFDMARSGDLPERVVLSPCNLALGIPHWIGDDRSEVRWGVNAAGECQAILDRSGTLRFPWSLRGKRLATTEREFQLRMPGTAQNYLQLELPSTSRLTVVQPVAISQEEASHDPARRIWNLELGGLREVTLRVEDQSGDTSSPNGVFVRESLHYRMAASGVELLATFHVDSHELPVRSFELEVDPELHVSAVKAGNKPISFRPAASAGDRALFELFFVEPLFGTDSEITIVAVAPTVLEKEWRLPAARLRRVDWIASSTTVECLSPLSLAAIFPRSSVQRKVEPLPLPLRGELRECQGISADHGIDLRLEIASQELSAETGTTLRFSESAVTGQVVADLRALRGEPFELRAAIQPGWVIDGVQSEPAELLEGFQTEGGRQPTLRVRLRQAVRPDLKSRLIIRGRRTALVTARPTNVSILQFLQWHHVVSHTGVTTMIVEPPLRLSVAGDLHVTRLDHVDLTESEASRIQASPGALIFRDGPATNVMTISLAETLPAYSAQIEVEAAADDSFFVQSTRVRISPERSHVDRILVRFSRGSADPPTWELLDADRNAISARRLDGRDASSEQELWEVMLNRPLNSPFTISATRKSAFSGDEQVVLAAIPEASSQGGLVRIVSNDGLPFDVNSSGLTGIAIARQDDKRIPALQGIYRYEPSQNVSLRLRRLALEESPALAWIWRADLATRVSGTGELRHELNLFIENSGLASIELRLPPDATLIHAASVDEEGEPDVPADSDLVVVPLEKGTRFPMVHLVYLSRAESFRFVAEVGSVWPITDLPCLSRIWTVWTPTQFRALPYLSDPGMADTWDRRLFGISLVRRAERVFDPFTAESWRQLGTDLLRSGPDVQSPPVGFDPTGSDRPWAAAPRLGADEDEAGWGSYSVSVSGHETPAMVVYSGSMVFAWSWGIVVAAAGILVFLMRRERYWLPRVLAATTMLLLVMPFEFTAPMRGLLYGSLVATLLASFSRRPASERFMPELLPTSGVRRELSTTIPAVAWFGALFVICAAHAFAQGPAISSFFPRPRANVVHPVLIPIDDAQKPIGDYVYIPEALFDELHRHAADTEDEGWGPLIAGAHYELQVDAAASAEAEPQWRPLTAEFELVNVSHGSQVALAFRRDQLRVVEARVDGTPVLHEWDESGRIVRFTLENADSQRLRLTMRPIVPNDQSSSLTLAIPRIPRSHVTVRTDSRLDGTDISSAVGSVTRVTPEQLTAELGPAEQLQIRWRELDAGERASLDVDAQQLVWMRVQPNAVLVDAQLRFSANTGRIEQVDVEVDPRLRLLPIDPEQWLHIEERIVRGTRILRCSLAQPFERHATIRLAFALNSGGIGNVRIPRLVAVAKQRAPLWLAISVADELAGQFEPGSPVETLAPAEFSKAWNRGEETPQMAVIVPPGNDDTYFSVRPRTSQTSVDQQVSMTFGHGQSEILYEGLFDADRSSMLQQRFHVPSLFTPREVTVIHDDITRLLRWSRVDSRTMAVFFNAPISGGFRIWIKGDMPLVRSGQAEIPIVSALDASDRKLNVRLFQLGDIQAKLANTRGWIPDTSSVPEYRIERGRFLGSLLLDNSTTMDRPSLQVSLRPNRPRVQGSLLTTLLFQNNRWTWQTSIELDVANGNVDTVRLQIPYEAAGPYQVDPEVAIDVRRSAGEGDREMILRLPEPADRAISLRISGQLTPPEGEPVTVPDISIRDFSDVQRYVALPRVVDRRTVSWETTGLQSAKLPGRQEHRGDPAVPVAVYQIVGNRMRAEWKGTEPVGMAPQVHLAEYRMHWFSDKQCHGFAAFDIQPSVRASVVLRASEPLELLRVAVGGAAVIPRRLTDRTWSLPIAIARLPQRIEVWFLGHAVSEKSSGVLTFAAPVIADLSCARTFWTIEGPSSEGNGVPLLKHAHVDGSAIASMRLEHSRRLLSAIESESSRDTSGDHEAWQASWTDWVQQLERGQNDNREDPAAGSGFPLERVRSYPRYDLTSPWQVAASGHAVHCELLGSAPQLSVYYEQRTWFPVAKRILTAVLVLGGAMALWRMLRLRAIRGTLRRYPHLATGLAGVAWWLWLTPSVVGLLALSIGVLLALRPTWATRTA